MLEPRGSLRSTVYLRADDDLLAEHESTSSRRSLRQPLLPTAPMHPSLEYELESVASASQRHRQQWKDTLYLVLASLGVVLSGIGIVVTAKLQSMSLFNYPNFTNVLSNVLYIPVCFAYIVPATTRASQTTRQGQRFRDYWRSYLSIGALDCVTTTVWTFASMYVSGPQLILLPQFAVPVSLLACYVAHRRHQNYYSSISNYELLGSLTVLIGILIALEPVLSHRHAPDYTCEAVDLWNHCTICQEFLTQASCLTKLGDDTTNTSPLCHWVKFEDRRQRTTESLEYMWSLALLFSALPLVASAHYKQRLLRESNDVMVVSGWIALFQGLFSIMLVYPMNWITEIHFTAESFWAGLSCYIGTNVLDKGCHPDRHCEAAAWHLYSTVFCHVVYTLSVLLVLKYSKNPLWLFLSLTIMVPLGNLIFAANLPILPTPIRAMNESTDYAGLLVVLAGLVLYRFTNNSQNKKVDRHPLYDPTLASDHAGEAIVPDDENDLVPAPETKTLSFFQSVASRYAVREQTSYTLVREDTVLTGDV